MSKITSKFQVSIPRSLAAKIGLQVGDELEWEEAAGMLRARAGPLPHASHSIEEKLRLFDAATARLKKRQRTQRLSRSKSRGWSREDLYKR